MKKTLPGSTATLDALNKAAEAFMSFSLNSFDDVMTKSIYPIAETVNAEKVIIFIKAASRQEIFSQFYRWNKAEGGTAPLGANIKELQPVTIEWFQNLMRGDSIFRRVDAMTEDEVKFLKAYGIKSIALVPIFEQDKFWGVVSFQACSGMRDFERYADLLQISARMIAGLAIRQKMIQEMSETASALESKKRLTDVLCKVAALLVPRLKDPFADRMTQGIGLIADAVNLDRVSVWRNFVLPDGLHMGQLYRWDKGSGGTTELPAALQNLPYDQGLARLQEIFARGEVINSPVRLLPEAAKMQSFGMVSAAFIPMNIDGDCFGHVIFEDLHQERYFGEDEIEMMRVAALLVTNTIIRDEMEYVVAEEQGFSEGVIKSIPLAYVQYDSDLKVLDYNDVAIQAFKAPDKQAFVDNYWETGSPEFQPDGLKSSVKAREMIDRAYTVGQCVFNWEYRTFDGEPLPMEVTLVRLDYGEKTYYLSFKYDLRPIRRYEEMLKNTLQELTVANRAKDEFLSNLSHGIRTPLNAILGVAEMHLHNDKLPMELQEGLKTVYSSGDLLFRIINDILDLSKIKAGKFDLAAAQYRVVTTINDVVNLSILGVGSKPIEFRLHIGENMPAELIGDELRLKQLLNYILSNAFKYTKIGEVVLSLSAEYTTLESGSPVTLVCHVKDTGIGMTDEQLEKIFDEYVSFSQESDGALTGVGLGLSIAWNLVHAMGGEISVESELGKGSVFTVRLPQKAVGPDTIGNAITQDICQFRFTSTPHLKDTQIVCEYMPYGSVLIVDDLETNLYVTKGLLSTYGLSIDTAASGGEAIDKIKEGKSYDIVFMDYMMPEMDGIEVTKRLRTLGYAKPIIVCTADAVVGRMEKYLDSGFDGYLSKPINTRRLNDLLNMLIRDKQRPETLDAARQQAVIAKENAAGKSTYSNVEPQLAEIFIRDAGKALALLEALSVKWEASSPSEQDVRIYTITVHSMKSALAIVGESKLYGYALDLEIAGREENIDVIRTRTPEFLRALRLVLERVRVRENDDDGAQMTDSVRAYLHEKLAVIRKACSEYDNKTARAALEDLRRTEWPASIKAALRLITESLLHSDYDEIVEIAEKTMHDDQNETNA